MDHSDDAAALDEALPTRKIYIQSSETITEIPLTRGRIIALSTVVGAAVVWSAIATAGFVIGTLGDTGRGAEIDMVEESYRTRIASLETQLAEATGRSETAVGRLDAALARISEQQDAVRAQIRETADLERALDAMRGKLAVAVAARDAAQDRAGALDVELAALRSDLSGATDAAELDTVLAAVSDALHSAVRERDTQKSDLDRLHSEMATMELKMEINADRQERMVASLEDAVEMSFKPLEGMFDNAGLDVDTLLDGVRANYSGIGGPETAVASLPLSVDPEMNDRFSDLMGDMDRMNMMRIAAAKVPFAMPVRAAHRFTSGFGMRRDPKTGGRRAHNGIDLAGPRGTPILATGDGVVVHASWQSGFGKLIKIRHAYGFETLYAHLNDMHVEVGDRIARGDHIGDMGTTGRSTGVHLHYEVRLGGQPVNPLTYIKAAKDVF